MSNSDEAQVTAPKRNAVRIAFRYAERVFAIVGGLLVIHLTCFNVSVVSSGSMSPTLQGESLFRGDTVLTERVSYHFRRPKRWEIVLFYDESGVQVMKRVVGLPGETIGLRDPYTVLIDGSPEERPVSLRALKYYSYGAFQEGKEARCERGYFLLGDDSRDSQDSRYIGPVVLDQIRGRAWLRVWPPSRIGFVNP